MNDLPHVTDPAITSEGTIQLAGQLAISATTVNAVATVDKQRRLGSGPTIDRRDEGA